jgi:hypothetical protein
VNCGRPTVNRNAVPRKFHRIALAASACTLLSACAHLVTISYPPEAVIHPAFNQRFTSWEGERVEVALTPPLRGDAFPYLTNSKQTLVADLIRQRGLRHEYNVPGEGTPLVVFSENPERTPEEKHYPATGIVLGLTAVREHRPGELPLLKVYDALDPSTVRTAHGAHPIAADYTATLAVLLSHGLKVAGSSAEDFHRPDQPRFATGIYLIHP